MIGEKVQAAFNEQFRHEAGSAYLYLSEAAWFNSHGFEGMAHWMVVQFGEETKHAMMFFDELHDRAGKVDLPAIARPKAAWRSPLDAFRDAYKHEQFITGKINDLVKLAAKEGDLAAVEFLQWFVNEQVEEEAQVLKIVQALELVGESGAGLIMLDKELGERK